MKLNMDILEARTMPAQSVWVATTPVPGQNYADASVAANWSGGVPAFGDDVLIQGGTVNISLFCLPRGDCGHSSYGPVEFPDGREYHLDLSGGSASRLWFWSGRG